MCEKDETVLDKYFKPYYDQIIRERHLLAKDFSDGISKIITALPELVMDCPKLHQIVYDYLIKPIRNANILNFKMVKWDIKPLVKEEDEDEDLLFEDTDA